MDKTLIEQFVEKARSKEQQFTLKHGHFFFTKLSLGTAACIYGDRDYHSSTFINELGTKLIPCAIVSNGEVFIIQKTLFGLYGAVKEALPPHTHTLDEKRIELNKKINEELFPSYYDSLPLRDLTEEELERAKEKVRDIILSDEGKTITPLMRELIDSQLTANTLYGLVNFDEYVMAQFEGDRERYITVKSINNKIDELAREVKGVAPWEIKLNLALRKLHNAKTITAEFDYEGITATGKFDRKTVLRKLGQNDYFSSYDFVTEISGRQIIKQLGAGTWKGHDKAPLSCEHISKITYGKKVVYSKGEV